MIARLRKPGPRSPLAVARLADAGARIEPVEVPPSFAYVAANTMLECCRGRRSASRALRGEEGSVRAGFAEFVERGLDTPAWEYIRRARECSGAFAVRSTTCSLRFDAILTPATPARRAGRNRHERKGDPFFNLPWSLSGHPVVAIALRARALGIADIDPAYRAPRLRRAGC